MPEHLHPTAKIRSHESRSSLLGGQATGLDAHYRAYPRHPGSAGGIQGSNKMYRPSSLWTWSFVLISLVQAFIVLGFECYVFGKFQSTIDDDKRPHEKSVQYAIPTFLALYIFGFIYQLILVYDALRLKNTIQVIGLCMFNVALLIYAAVQMDQIKKTGDPIADKVFHDTKPYLIAIPCILALGTVLMTFVARKLYDEFAWTIYKHISADLKMKRRYLTFQVCSHSFP